MKIVCLSDIHNQLANITVPDGDVLVIAGDLTGRGRPQEVMQFGKELAKLPHKHKVVIAGNHDFLFQKNPDQARELLCVDSSITYLQDSSTTIEGVKFYGSPWQPWFYDWAFNLQRGEQLRAVWDKIPDDTNVLITHGPPYGILDVVPRFNTPEHVGCEELTKRIMNLKDLKLCVFGHIHESRGAVEHGGPIFVNAAVLDGRYETVKVPPITVEI